jgi:Tfp pilus assembly protein PilX
MNLKTFKKSKRFRQNDGVALLTTLLLLFLMSSLLVGFAVLLLSNQQLAGANNDQVVAFYAAEAGMEKMTADLGNLFGQTYSPSIGQINGLETTPYGPPQSSLFTGESVTYTTADGNPGYTIVPAAVDNNGNPAPTITTIKSGTYQGMTAMATEYTLTVNARTSTGREVNLVRTTQTVGIPMFQFGIFANTDLDFFPGPQFNFGGRTHTNGNLWLATSGGPLTLGDKVDAYKDVLRTRLENGYSVNTAGDTYTGTVNVTTSPGTGNYRALGTNEGSLTGTIPPYDTPTRNTNWQTVSQTDYNSNLTNGQGSYFPQYSTGASLLNLAVVTIGNGTTQSIDLIRRPAQGEGSNITNERYFAQASLRIQLSDNPADIMNQNCVDQGTQPFDLSYLATPPGVGGANWLASTYAPLVTLTKKMIANGVPLIPLPASGAASSAAYTSTDGYWLPTSTGSPGVNNGANFFPIVKGFIKIEAQIAPYPSACTSADQTDVTLEVLALGYIGRNINPVPQSLDGANINPEWYYNGTDMSSGKAPAITSLPTAALGYQNSTTTPPGGGTFQTSSVSTVAKPQACTDPHPNAIIRLARIRDNPSSVFYTPGAPSKTNLPALSSVGEACGVDPAAPTVLTTTRSGQSTGGVYGTYSTWLPQPYDTWNNTLFDTREGTLRDESMSTSNLPTLNGTMHYVELDARNVSRWFGGVIGASGQSTKDSVVAPDNFTVYFSDRRGNYDNGTTFATWPATSFTKNETGEYGWNDLVNSGTDGNGCPDNILEQGEDLDGVNTLYTYGANEKYIHGAGLGLTAGTALNYGQYGVFNGLAGATAASAVTTATIPCTTIPTYSNITNSDGIWPMMVASVPNAARENPPLFFRRALKIVNGSNLTAVGACPGGVNCGLTIAAENPVYIQGDYNANVGGAGWGSTEIASSVAADAVTLLSDQWNDVNSFSSPYSTANRSGNTTWYRLAIVGGATLPFTQPTFGGVSADFGTDGGVHNFLRYIEAWGGTLEYNGSIVDLYTSRQATGTFKCCATVYSPPTRGYNFDINFLNPTLLPPRTPLFRTVSTTGWTRVLSPEANSYK